MSRVSQKGVVHILPLLIVVAAVGIISFLLVSSSAPFSSGLNKNLYPMQASHAANSAFVTRTGPDLFVNGSRMRIVGANNFFFGYAAYQGCCTTFPGQLSHPITEDVINQTEMMGANVIRTFAAISVGCLNKEGLPAWVPSSTGCVEPTLNTFYDGTNGHPNNYEAFDYALSYAKNHNIRFILPLVDNYQYYHGGKYTYLAWRGVSNAKNGINFFLDPTVKQDFKNHIQNALNHVNQYTGIAYKDDPTIMAWELGTGELSICDGATAPGCQTWPQPTSYSDWAQEITRYIKSIDKNHLVSDGHFGSYIAQEGQSLSALYSIPEIDIFSDHAYNDNQGPSQMVAEANLVRNTYQKVFYIGEFTWTAKTPSGTVLNWTLPQMLSAVESSSINGDLFWQLGPKGFSGTTGLELHYPGDNPTMATAAAQLKNHAFVMCQVNGTCRNGTATPSPAPTPNVDPVGYVNTIDCTQINGWVCDKNDFSQPLTVQIYKDAPSPTGTQVGTAIANVQRPDLITANVCGGTGNHGISAPLPASLKDGKPHQVYINPINIPAGNNSVLNGSPKTVNCVTSTPSLTPSPTVTPQPTAKPSSPANQVRWDNHAPFSNAVHSSYNIVNFSLSNTGTQPWAAGGATPVHISYWWTNTSGQAVLWGDHETITRDIPSGGQISNLQVGIVTPSVPGSYTLHMSMIQEPNIWFGPILDLPVNIN